MAALALIAGSEAARAGGASFEPLGDLPGSLSLSQAWGVSADGRVVVGTAHPAGVISEGFRWTSEEGMRGLGLLPAGNPASEARAASSDGSVIVGGSGSNGFRWTALTGLMALDMRMAFGVSGDGGVVVGWRPPFPGHGAAQAVRWTAEDGVVPLGDPPGTTSSDAWGVSEDGRVVVGSVSAPSGFGYPQAFLWGPGGDHFLGDLPGGSPFSLARDVSRDGPVVVGQGSSGSGFEAFRWEAATGMVGLGDLAGSVFRSEALAVSGDGSVIVGRSQAGAFIWDATNGMRDLREVVTVELGLDLMGWQLVAATDVSQDGRTVVGYGSSPTGTEAWLVRFPDPVEEVAIDIRPGDPYNSVRPGSPAVLRVALLGSEELDVSTVDPTTLAFGPGGAAPRAPGALLDVNRDDRIDLVAEFSTLEAGITPTDTEACLSGELGDGGSFEGCDAVTPVPACSTCG